MESLIVATAQEKENILKLYNTSEAGVTRDVEIIKAWKEKQPHLPQNVPDDFIGNMLLKNKFRVEKTKQKLDNYYSLRGQHKDLVCGLENLVPSKHITTYLPLPKLTPSLERIIIVKLLNTNPEDFDMHEVAKIDLCMEEFHLRFDYCYGVRYICDYSGVSVKHLPKLSPTLIAKLTHLIERGYSNRVLGVDFINFPSFAGKILTLLKMVAPPKISARIRIHENLDTLYELIPKEYLPVEYGGNLGNIPDFLRRWDKVVEDHRDFFLENYHNVSAEHLRPANSKICNDSFGVEGAFKKLQID